MILEKTTRSRPAASAKAQIEWRRKHNEHGSDVSAEMIASADAVIARITSKFCVEGSLQHDPDKWLSRVGDAVRKMSNKEHLSRLEIAYALTVKAQSDPRIHDDMLQFLGSKRLRISNRTTILHLLVEHVIIYGENSHASRREARKLYNRDVRAVRHLEKTNVPPDQVVKLGRQRGQGLNTWARGGKIGKILSLENSNPLLDHQNDDDKNSALSNNYIQSRMLPRYVDRQSKQAGGDQRENNPENYIDTIEWKSEDSLVRRIFLPATPEAKALVENVFELLRASAELITARKPTSVAMPTADSDRAIAVSKIVDSATDLMNGLGSSDTSHAPKSIPKRKLSGVSEPASKFLSDLSQHISDQPITERQIHKERARLELIPKTRKTKANSK